MNQRPLPPGEYLLPGDQKYQHLIVQKDGQEIVLVDYIDEQVAAEVVVNLGPHFRLFEVEKVEVDGDTT